VAMRSAHVRQLERREATLRKAAADTRNEARKKLSKMQKATEQALLKGVAPRVDPTILEVVKVAEAPLPTRTHPAVFRYLSKLSIRHRRLSHNQLVKSWITERGRFDELLLQLARACMTKAMVMDRIPKLDCGAPWRAERFAKAYMGEETLLRPVRPPFPLKASQKELARDVRACQALTAELHERMVAERSHDAADATKQEAAEVDKNDSSHSHLPAELPESLQRLMEERLEEHFNSCHGSHRAVVESEEHQARLAERQTQMEQALRMQDFNATKTGVQKLLNL